MSGRALRAVGALVAWEAAGLLALLQVQPVLALALVLAGLALLPEGRTHGPGSTHDRIHAPLADYVTHGSRTAVTENRITPGQGQSRTLHGTHTQGACTFPPPSLQGGNVRPSPVPDQ